MTVSDDIRRKKLSFVFPRVPLVIEVWHRDPFTKDVMIGVATVTLAHVFAAKKLKAAVGQLFF